MSLLKDAIETLFGYGKQSVKPTVLEIPNTPGKRILITPAGEKEIDIPRSKRQMQLETLQSFVDACKTYRDGPNSSIWVTPERITMVVDENTDHTDSVVMELQYSQSAQILFDADLRKGAKLTQRQFVTLLRNELFGQVPGSLLEKISKIEASSGSKTTSEASHGRDKGTREYQAEIVGSAELPEQFRVSFPLFGNVRTEKSEVECSLSVDPNTLEFTIRPLPEEMTIASQKAIMDLQDQIAKFFTDDPSAVPVFLGKLQE
jgi:hypothetical protein